MIKYFLYLFFVCVLISCGSKKEKAKMQMPKWLAGAWISREDSVEFLESWELKNDSLFKGKGIAYKGTETLFQEEIEIRRVDDTLYYIPTVADQNQGKAVWFKIISVDSFGFMAENQLHDFPKTINYQLKGADSIYAILKGFENGEARTEVFAMKKK